MLDAPGGPAYIPDEGDLPAHRFLLVDAGERVVAVAAAGVLEVITARVYGRIPGTEPAIAGVVNRRGRLLTVVDLGIVLGDRSSRAIPDHRIVVVQWGERMIGLAVKDVLQFSDEADDDRIVDVESLLPPLFGGAEGGEGGGGSGEPSLERS